MYQMFWVFLLAVLMIAGCVKTSGYEMEINFPNHWPPRSSTFDCQNIIGVYFINAEVYKGDKFLFNEKGLSPLSFGVANLVPNPMFGKTLNGKAEASIFEIEKNGKGFWLKSLPFEGEAWVYNDFSYIWAENICDRGFYVYKEYTEFSGDESGFYNERSKRWVGKLEDGSLFVYIQKHKYKKFIFSNPEPEHIFYRFKPYTGELPQ
ncbi:MAG: hypothetical protein KDI30_11790 [Pseudomonadales bacterium]|nr:hypothetical protein [Pseudomonadales bacterium]